MSDDLAARAVSNPRYTPNDMEREAKALLDKLVPLRDAETDKRKRKELSSRIKLARSLRNWARTRAGYVPTSMRASAPNPPLR